MSKIAIAVNRENGLDITYGGKTGLLQNASSCEIDPSDGDFELNCAWDFGPDIASARGLFSAYRIRLQSCLTQPMAHQERREYGKSVILDAYESEIAHKDDTETTISLKLRESSHYDPPRYFVEFGVDRF